MTAKPNNKRPIALPATVWLPGSLLFVLSSRVDACAVCFGLANSLGLSHGFFWGILLLLLLPFGLVLAIGGWIYFAQRKHSALSEAVPKP